MDPIQIVLIVLVLAGVWALVELALVLRRTRTTVDSLTKTVDQLSDTVNEARPVVAKLDGAIDELQPALAHVDPIMKQLSASSEALSADLLEVNGILRDISQVTGNVSDVSGAVSSITDTATEKVQKLLGKRPKAPAAPDQPAPSLTGEAPAASADASSGVHETAPEAACQPEPQYFTYAADSTPESPAPASKEATDE